MHIVSQALSALSCSHSTVMCCDLSCSVLRKHTYSGFSFIGVEKGQGIWVEGGSKIGQRQDLGEGGRHMCVCVCPYTEMM